MFIIKTQNGTDSPPLTPIEIRTMIKSGTVRPDALARRDTDGGWGKLYSFPEFFTVVPGNVPPPPGSYSKSPFEKKTLRQIQESDDVFMYADEDGNVFGPHNVSELKYMLRNSMITHRTRVNRGGNSAWRELGAQPEFFGFPVPKSNPPATSYSRPAFASE
ncbi:hypothetical protein CKA38_03915 [Ereboglobus luteus]|uniref:GYF domain-containing protein n=2 Tax=Ereboglobus luteus TaxID=1796921 RepID=A0A2U8E0Y2_9BACT|nr:hypothetical protein CKA38_03915 [Ereboglobus luteus]